MESPSSATVSSPAIDGAAASAAMEPEAVLCQVDPFLVETLENPRHRLTVLRMELDIQKFMQTPDQYIFEFQHLPTSYLRRAAHRVAQHYCLQTTALGNIVDGLGSRVIARKTPDSIFPSVCLSEVPAKQHETEITEKVKIAIRPRETKASPNGTAELDSKSSAVKTVEERKEEYDKARARIFNGSSSLEMEGFSIIPSDGRTSYPCVDEQLYRIVDENERAVMKDDASRVAIFRDREKDRSDPDYDRSYDRYVRGPAPNLTLCMGGHDALQLPLPQYEAGFSPVIQMPRNPASISYMPSNMTMSQLSAFRQGQSSKGAIYMQWPSPAMVYAHSYEHLRHGVFQAPYYQQHLSFDHLQTARGM